MPLREHIMSILATDNHTPLSVSQVLNSHSHVMYILSIVLAKYTEIKVSLKSRKTMD